MTMTLHHLSIPAYINGLRALSGQLGKALAWGADNGVGEFQFIASRLAPDMFPLATQVRYACMQSVQAPTKLGATGAPALAEDATDFAALQTQIAETIAWLDSVTVEALGSDSARPVGFDLPNGMAFDMTADSYLRDWAQPQFYFHAVAAYSILRHMGIPLGKIDYVGYMLQYLRPGTAPAS